MSDNGKKKKIIVIAIIAVLLIAALIIFLVFRSKIRATTMRLLRIEGIVTMQEDGRNRDVKENLRLKSGNVLDTAASSLVSIGLDDYKIVTMDEFSRAEFNQEGKYLNLNLTKGSIFFEVDKALASDESFEIETSTMVVGIRGTSGWVSVAGENESLIITDGRVHVIGTNPVTHEVKEVDVSAGQRLVVYLYNDRSVDSIMFELETITERELPEFVLRILRENAKLLDRVIAATGWDKPWILGLTDEENPSGTGDEGSGTGNTVSSNTDTEPDTNPDPGNQTGDADGNEPGDVGGNDDKPAQDDAAADANATGNVAANEPEPAVAPTLTVLEQQIAAAREQIANENADGTIELRDGTVFDPDYYATRYPDVASAYGTDSDELLAHYVANGQSEGRYASEQEEREALLAAALAQQEANRIADEAQEVINQQQQQQQQQQNQQQQQQRRGNATLGDGSSLNVNTTTGAITILGGSTANSNSVTLPATITVNGTQVAVNLNNVTVDSSSGVTHVDISAIANDYTISSVYVSQSTEDAQMFALQNPGVRVETATAIAVASAASTTQNNALIDLTIKTAGQGHPGITANGNAPNPDGRGAYEISNYLGGSGTRYHSLTYGGLTMEFNTTYPGQYVINNSGPYDSPSALQMGGMGTYQIDAFEYSTGVPSQVTIGTIDENGFTP